MHVPMNAIAMEKNTSGNTNFFEKGKHPLELLLKQKSEYATFLKPGDIIEGMVIEKKGSRLFVDLGVIGTGIVFGREYYEAQDAIKGLIVGDRITAKVVEADNEDGYVELSLKEAGRERDWQEMRRLMETGETMPLKVLEANRGGLIINYLGTQGFLPASQLSQEHYPRVEGGDKEKIFESLKTLVGKDLDVSIIDINPEEGKLIFSEKNKETEAVKQRLVNYHVGDVIEGEVAGIVSFGAFVKFGDGLEGLVHISEIDWQLIANPADVLKIGEKVRAKVIGIEGDRVSLSLKALKEDPWSKVDAKYAKGQRLTGTVVKFNSFGAFVKLDEEIQGLAHISEFGTEARMREVLKVGEPHEFVILSVSAKEHRLALGLIRDEAGAETAPTMDAPADSAAPAPSSDDTSAPAA